MHKAQRDQVERGVRCRESQESGVLSRPARECARAACRLRLAAHLREVFAQARWSILLLSYTLYIYACFSLMRLCVQVQVLDGEDVAEPAPRQQRTRQRGCHTRRVSAAVGCALRHDKSVRTLAKDPIYARESTRRAHSASRTLSSKSKKMFSCKHTTRSLGLTIHYWMDLFECNLMWCFEFWRGALARNYFRRLRASHRIAACYKHHKSRKYLAQLHAVYGYSISR